MSTTSTIAICMKNAVFEKLPLALLDIFVDAGGTFTRADGVMVLLKDVEWDTSDDWVASVYSFLQGQRNGDWLLLEACHDYPTDEDNDAGAWRDNPWSCRKVVSVNIEHDGEEDKG